jgi:hypothetical protein
MLLVLLDGRYVAAHHIQHAYILSVKDLTLQEA